MISNKVLQLIEQKNYDEAYEHRKDYEKDIEDYMFLLYYLSEHGYLPAMHEIWTLEYVERMIKTKDEAVLSTDGGKTSISKYLRKNPNSIIANVQMGKYYCDIENTEKGISYYNQALKSFKRGDVESYVPYPEITVRELKITALNTFEKYEDALEEIAKLEDIDPENEEILFEKARIYLGLGDDKMALTYIRKYLKTNKIPQAYNIKGEALSNMGKYHEACLSYQDALLKRNTVTNLGLEVDTHYKLAKCHDYLGEYQRAVIFYNKTINLVDKFGTDFYNYDEKVIEDCKTRKNELIETYNVKDKSGFSPLPLFIIIFIIIIIISYFIFR